MVRIDFISRHAKKMAKEYRHEFFVALIPLVTDFKAAVFASSLTGFIFLYAVEEYLSSRGGAPPGS